MGSGETGVSDERIEIIYESGSPAEALRAVADRFDADPNLVLVGLWNIEPVEPFLLGYPEAYLQVVVSHLEAPTHPEEDQ